MVNFSQLAILKLLSQRKGKSRVTGWRKATCPAFGGIEGPSNWLHMLEGQPFRRRAFFSSGGVVWGRIIEVGEDLILKSMC